MKFYFFLKKHMRKILVFSGDSDEAKYLLVLLVELNF